MELGRLGGLELGVLGAPPGMLEGRLGGLLEGLDGGEDALLQPLVSSTVSSAPAMLRGRVAVAAGLFDLLGMA